MKFLDKLVTVFGLATYRDSLRTGRVVAWQRAMACVMAVAFVIFASVSYVAGRLNFDESWLVNGLVALMMGIVVLLLCNRIVVADLTRGWRSWLRYIGLGLGVLILAASATLPVSITLFETKIEQKIMLKEKAARPAYEKQRDARIEDKLNEPPWRIPRTHREKARLFNKIWHEEAEVKWIAYAVFAFLILVDGGLLWFLKLLARGDFHDYYSAREQRLHGVTPSQGPRET